MVEELRSQNLLEETLTQVEEQTADLLHLLVSVEKMDYQEAWEIATREWAFLPTEDSESSPIDSIRNRKKRPPVIS